MKKTRILWKVKVLDYERASVRIRTIIPALELEKAGHVIRMGDKHPSDRELELADVIIINKSFTDYDVSIARKAKEFKKPLIIDLCDNIFVNNCTKLDIEFNNNFRKIVDYADRIVTTNNTLANIIREQIDRDIKIVVIMDSFDDPEILKPDDLIIFSKKWLYIPRFWIKKLKIVINEKTGRYLYVLFIKNRHLFYKINSLINLVMYYVLFFIDYIDNGRKSDNRKTVVWFGNKGDHHGKYGVICLQDIIRHLERINEIIPLQLLVISKGYFHFRKITKDFEIPCHFRQWHIKKFCDLISSSDVCIIPSSRDSFSLTKSANRTVLSLMLGVPVVADYIPAMEPFKECIHINNWRNGLLTCLEERDEVSRDIREARAIIKHEYTADKIAANWSTLIADVLAENTGPSHI